MTLLHIEPIPPNSNPDFGRFISGLTKPKPITQSNLICFLHGDTTQIPGLRLPYTTKAIVSWFKKLGYNETYLLARYDKGLVFIIAPYNPYQKYYCRLEYDTSNDTIVVTGDTPFPAFKDPVDQADEGVITYNENTNDDIKITLKGMIKGYITTNTQWTDIQEHFNKMGYSTYDITCQVDDLLKDGDIYEPVIGVISRTVLDETQQNNNPEQEIPTVKPEEAIDQTNENEKITVTCYNCGHVFDTQVYYNNGKVDKRRTQARCSKCKRKNTAQVVKSVEGGVNTTGRKETLTPAKEPTETQLPTAEKPNINISKVTPSPQTRKVIEDSKDKMNKVTQPTDMNNPKTSIQDTITQPQQPVIVQDWTPMFNIAHNLEGELLYEIYQKELLDNDKIKMLDNSGNQMMNQLSMMYPGVMTGPWVPIGMYVGSQLAIIGGPLLIDWIKERRLEREKQSGPGTDANK